MGQRVVHAVRAAPGRATRLTEAIYVIQLATNTRSATVSILPPHRLPGPMNGLDTIKKIRSKSGVPIIAMSGFRLRNSLDAEQDFLGMAIRHGATTSLRKPFSPPQLVAAIDRSRGMAPPTGEPSL